MSTEIVADSDFYDPTNLIPYFEKDDAIIRALTKGMVDFSNPDSFAGGQIPAGAIAAGTGIKSLTSDAAAGSMVSAFAAGALANGMLDLSGGSKTVALPPAFKLAPTCRAFVAIVWAYLPAAGYTIAANSSQPVFGVMQNTSSAAQFGLYIGSDAATGAAKTINAMFPRGSTGAWVQYITDVSALGALRQFAVAWDAERPVAGYGRNMLMIDKAVKIDALASFDGTMLVPAFGATLGYPLAAYQPVSPAGFKVGRPSLWDLTGATGINGKAMNFDEMVAAIVQRDWDAAQGFLS